jgi:hypothetical protein
MGDDEKPETVPEGGSKESRKSKGREKTTEAKEVHLKDSSDEALQSEEADNAENQSEEETAETPPAVHKAEAPKVKGTDAAEMQKLAGVATSPTTVPGKSIAELMRFRRVPRKRRY